MVCGCLNICSYVMYRRFEVIVLQCVELDFVYDLVLNLQCLLVLSF